MWPASCPQGQDVASTFMVGYLVEKTLSVDNLLVMLLIFKSFKIREAYQTRVLKWGIMGAILMRAVFIMAGVRLIETFEWAVPIFGATLIVAAYKMIRDHRETRDGGLKETIPTAMLWLPTATAEENRGERAAQHTW